jgi:GntR family transcriptional regulator/MocR family aminotransferase
LSYEHLLSEGYLETLQGSGTYVCQEIPDELSRVSVSEKLTTQERSEPRLPLSAYGTNLLSIVPDERSQLFDISFQLRASDLNEIPLKPWRQLLSRYCRENQASLFDYAENSQGYPPLREAIANYLVRTRGVRCDPEQVIIVNGSQQALDLITRILINPGDPIAVEDPGWLYAKRVFSAYQGILEPIAVDQSGLMVEELQNSQAKLIYITPSHQFPTGVILSLSRRLELLSWATQTGAIIIEDDYDHEFRYNAYPIPALQGLGENNSVIYIGTFSKVLFPALRIGYLVVPKSLVKIFTTAKQLSDRQSPMFEQLVLTDFMNEGYLERHVRKMRKIYEERQKTLIQAIQHYLGNQVSILGDNAGLHLMIELHTSLKPKDIVARAAASGLELVSAESFYLKKSDRCELILGYGNLSIEQIQEGIYRLSQLL